MLSASTCSASSGLCLTKFGCLNRRASVSPASFCISGFHSRPWYAAPLPGRDLREATALTAPRSAFFAESVILRFAAGGGASNASSSSSDSSSADAAASSSSGHRTLVQLLAASADLAGIALDGAVSSQVQREDVTSHRRLIKEVHVDDDVSKPAHESRFGKRRG